MNRTQPAAGTASGVRTLLGDPVYHLSFHVSSSSSAGVSVLCLLLARLRLSAVVCAEGYRGGAAVAGGAGGRQMNQLAGGQINTVVV